MNIYRLAGMGAIAMAMASEARCAFVEFQFGGTIVSASTAGGPAWSPPSPFTSVQVGQTWSLRYVFDTAQPASPTDPGFFNGAIREYELRIGSATLRSPPIPSGMFGAITVRSSPGDQYDVAIPLASSGVPVSTGVYLFDSTGVALGSGAGLPTNLNIEAFPTKFFFLGPLNAPNQYRGTITSFVPGAGTAGGVLIGVIMGMRRRRAFSIA